MGRHWVSGGGENNEAEGENIDHGQWIQLHNTSALAVFVKAL